MPPTNFRLKHLRRVLKSTFVSPLTSAETEAYVAGSQYVRIARPIWIFKEPAIALKNEAIVIVVSVVVSLRLLDLYLQSFKKQQVICGLIGLHNKEGTSIL